MSRLKINPPGDKYFAPLLELPNDMHEHLTEGWQSNAQTRLDVLFAETFRYSMHQLYKEKWDRQHKNPVGRAFQAPAKDFVQLSRAILEVCEYAYLYVQKWEYSHHLQWFFGLVFEAWQLEMDLPTGTKSGKAEQLRAIIPTLEEYRNPFNQKDNPHLYLLAESIAVVQAQPQHRNASRKLLRSSKSEPLGLFVVLRKLAQRYDKDPAWRLTWAEGTMIYARTGSGRGIESVNLKNRAKSLATENLSDKGFQRFKNP